MTTKRCEILSFSIVAILVQISVGAAEERAARIDVVKSGPVSLGDGDYVLVARGGHELSLQHVGTDGTSEWSIKPKELQNENVALGVRWPIDEIGGRITQIVLARWSRPSLIAVVRISRGEKTEFWCLGFRHVVASSRGKNELAPRAALAIQGDAEDRVLALSANIDPPAFTIVTGQLSKTNPNAVEQGAIAFEWCGFEEFARAGRFKPEYPAAE